MTQCSVKTVRFLEKTASYNTSLKNLCTSIDPTIEIHRLFKEYFQFAAIFLNGDGKEVLVGSRCFFQTQNIKEGPRYLGHRLD